MDRLITDLTHSLFISSRLSLLSPRVLFPLFLSLSLSLARPRAAKALAHARSHTPTCSASFLQDCVVAFLVVTSFVTSLDAREYKLSAVSLRARTTCLKVESLPLLTSPHPTPPHPSSLSVLHSFSPLFTLFSVRKNPWDTSLWHESFTFSWLSFCREGDRRTRTWYSRVSRRSNQSSKRG